MKDIREAIKRERHSQLEAKICPGCSKWFSTQKASRIQCWRCEYQEGQAADQLEG